MALFGGTSSCIRCVSDKECGLIISITPALGDSYTTMKSTGECAMFVSSRVSIISLACARHLPSLMADTHQAALN